MDGPAPNLSRPRLALAVSVASAALFVAFAQATAAGVFQSFDEYVVRATDVYRGPMFDRIMLEFSALADGAVVLATAGLLAMFLWVLNRRGTAYFIAATAVGGLALLAILKVGFDRPRPDSTDWGTAALSHAFPSGHAMSVVLLYGAILHALNRLGAGDTLRRISWAGVAFLIVMVGLSRVALGVHYLSDVLAGYLAGIAWISFAVAAASRIWPHR